MCGTISRRKEASENQRCGEFIVPVCEVCEEVVDKVYTCVECGVDFCKNCGDPDPKKKLCVLCSYAVEGEEWPEEEGEEWGE